MPLVLMVLFIVNVDFKLTKPDSVILTYCKIPYIYKFINKTIYYLIPYLFNFLEMVAFDTFRRWANFRVEE